MDTDAEARFLSVSICVHPWFLFSSKILPCMNGLLAVMNIVCDKPGMYVGHGRMPQVRAFLDGYVMALNDSGQMSDYPFGGFLTWLEQRHGICHPAWGWDRILVHAAGSDREAIRILEGLDEGTTGGSLLSLRPRQMRVFQSPNHALRLQQD